MLRTGCCFQVVFRFLLLSSAKMEFKKLRTDRCFQVVFCRKGVSKAKDGMLFSSGISLSTFQLLVKRGFQKVKDGMLFSGGISPNVTLKQFFEHSACY